MAEATAVRLVFAIAGGAKVIKPTFYLADSPGATSTGVPVGELQALADDVAAAVSSSGLMANFANDVEFLHAEVQNMEHEGPTPTNPLDHLTPTTIAFISATGNLTGTAAGDSTPPMVSVIVSFRTATPGRSFRGRMYLPPAPEGSNNSDGTLTTGAESAIFADVGSILAAAVGSPTVAPDLVVFSRVANLTTEVLAGASGVDVRSHLATQRRRRVASN